MAVGSECGLTVSRGASEVAVGSESGLTASHGASKVAVGSENDHFRIHLSGWFCNDLSTSY